MSDVVVGIVNYEDHILMVKRAKQEEKLVWVFPGGKVQEGETREEACIREIYEETGLNVSIIKLFGERIHPETGVKITYFLCKYDGGQIIIQNKDEILEIAYKTREEFLQDVKIDVYEPVKEYIKKYIK